MSYGTQERLKPGTAVRAKVTGLYNIYPFPGTLDAYGPWQNQAPNLLKNLGLDPKSVSGKRVLDAGCGTGEFSRSFANLGAQVLGVDITEESLRRARYYDRRLGLEGTEYCLGNLFDLPTNETFDIVASMGVLHHTEDPERAFHSVASRVKPDGLLIIGLYNPTSRAHIYATRALINAVSAGDTEKGIQIASSPVFQPLIRRCVGVQNASKPERIADLLVHPHEIPISLKDSLDWYQKAGFEVVGSSPSTDIQDYPQLRWMSGRMPQNVQHTAIELRWLSWMADYYVLAGRN